MTTLDDIIAERVRDAVAEAVRDVLTELSDRPLVVTADQAAELLQVSRRQVENWLAAGVLPRLPHTARILIPRVGLEAFASQVRSHTVGEGVAAGACGESSAATPELADRRAS
jgi:hypothetical protein